MPLPFRTALLLLGFLAAAGDAKVIRLALMAGHNRGAVEDKDLRFAEADARKMARLLVEAGGTDPAHVQLLESPRPGDLDQAFERAAAMAAAAPSGDEVIFLFYFSGHGSREALKLGAEPYPLQRLKERVDRVPAKLRLGILDACQSGAITRMKGGRLAPSVAPSVIMGAELRSAGTIYIASSAEDESSQESQRLKGSYFTHHLHTGLRGAADVSGDRRVSLLEAYSYAYDKTLAHTGSTNGVAQHPNAQFKLDTEGDVVLIDLERARGGMRLMPGVEGHLLVVNDEMEIVAELHKGSAAETRLSLPAGRYRIFQRQGRTTRKTKVKVAEEGFLDIGASDLSAGGLLAGLLKGREEEEELDIPWTREDRSSQRPWELGFGYAEDSFHRSYVLRAGYMLRPPVGLVATYNQNKVDFYKGMFDASAFHADLRLGIQVSRFLAPDFEFLLTGFHRASLRAVETWSGACSIDDVRNKTCDLSREYRKRWFWNEGDGVLFAMRIWLLNRLSFQIQYGTQFVWDDDSFNEEPILFLPSLHF